MIGISLMFCCAAKWQQSTSRVQHCLMSCTATVSCIQTMDCTYLAIVVEHGYLVTHSVLRFSSVLPDDRKKWHHSPLVIRIEWLWQWQFLSFSLMSKVLWADPREVGDLKKIVIWVRAYILLLRARKAWIQVKRHVNPHLWTVPINCGQQLGILGSLDPILANLVSPEWGQVWRLTWGFFLA